MHQSGLDKLIAENGAICLYKKSESMEKDWQTRWQLFQEQGHWLHMSERRTVERIITGDKFRNSKRHIRARNLISLLIRAHC